VQRQGDLLLPANPHHPRTPTRADISPLPSSIRRLGSPSAALFTVFVLFVLLFPAMNPAQTQSKEQVQAPVSGEIKGTVTDEGKPLAGAKLRLANVYAGKTFKIKADVYGQFLLDDAPYGYYDLEVTSADGERLLEQQISITPAGVARTATVNIDVSQSKMSTQPGDAGTYGTVRTLPEPNIKNNQKRNKAIEKQNEKISYMNALILQANAAVREQRWQDGLAPLLELTGMDPDYWEYLKELGDVQYHLARYQEAIGSYESGILAAGDVSGSEPKTGDADFALKKAAVSNMLNNEGLAYEKLHKTREAIAALNSAAALSADPALAYFNLCVTQYNLKSVEGTMAACDKAISVNPRKAEPYYFKGALLVYVNQSAVTGRVAAPPAGAAEALHKYLELAPEGEHAAQVREMLSHLAAWGSATAVDTRKN
jgi:tetratricopeptide (TPR) repeat protein